MIASAATERRELAHRSTNGIEVTLLWGKSTNAVTIAVTDSHSADELEFQVDGRRALDAFTHPHACAATVRVHSTRAGRASGQATLNSQPHQPGWASAQLSAIRREVAAETEDHS